MAELHLLSIPELNERAAPNDILEGFLYDGLVVLASAEGVGKSFLAIHVGLHVAVAKVQKDFQWHDGRWINGGGVIYCAAEGLQGLKARVNTALYELVGRDRDTEYELGVPHWTISPEQVPFFVVSEQMDICDPADVHRFLELVQGSKETLGLDPIRMVVFDTVSRYMPGRDENKQQDMSAFISGCDLVRKTLGCTVVVLHHCNKEGNIRGSTALPGAADMVFWTDAEKGNLKNMTVMWTTEGQNGKWKEGDTITQYFRFEPRPIRDVAGYMVEDVDSATGESKGFSTTLVVKPVEATANRELSGLPKMVYDVVASAKNGMSLTTLADTVKRDAGNLVKILKRLKEEGRVSQNPTTKVWSVVEEARNAFDVQ